MDVSYSPFTVNMKVQGIVVRVHDITETKKLNK